MNPVPDDQQACRTAFGKALAAWLRRNGWSQQTLHDWAKAAGSPGPWNSQVSLCARGALQMKPDFWIGLAAFNRAVAAQDFKLITSRGLRDRLVGSEPFRTADGRIASAAGFFAMFIGEEPLPDDYVLPEQPVYTEEDAKGLSDMCRAQFKQIATDLMLNPKEAWEELKPLCNGMSATEVTRFREVLAGWEDWSADEVNALSVPGELGKPAQALQRWGGNGLSNDVFSIRGT